MLWSAAHLSFLQQRISDNNATFSPGGTRFELDLANQIHHGLLLYV